MFKIIKGEGEVSQIFKIRYSVLLTYLVSFNGFSVILRVTPKSWNFVNRILKLLSGKDFI